jgi:hypothetical protein
MSTILQNRKPPMGHRLALPYLAAAGIIGMASAALVEPHLAHGAADAAREPATGDCGL